jgi:exonuclease V
MLYHRLLAALAVNAVDFSVLTTRYNLDPGKAFSDQFIAQVGSLNDELFSRDQEKSTGNHESELNSSQDSLATLLAHNNLSALWSLMISEFQLTLPNGAASLGSILKAEYRSRGDGEVRLILLIISCLFSSRLLRHALAPIFYGSNCSNSLDRLLEAKFSSWMMQI